MCGLRPIRGEGLAWRLGGGGGLGGRQAPGADCTGAAPVLDVLLLVPLGWGCWRGMGVVMTVVVLATGCCGFCCSWEAVAAGGALLGGTAAPGPAACVEGGCVAGAGAGAGAIVSCFVFSTTRLRRPPGAPMPGAPMLAGCISPPDPAEGPAATRVCMRLSCGLHVAGCCSCQLAADAGRDCRASARGSIAADAQLLSEGLMGACSWRPPQGMVLRKLWASPATLFSAVVARVVLPGCASGRNSPVGWSNRFSTNTC